MDNDRLCNARRVATPGLAKPLKVLRSLVQTPHIKFSFYDIDELHSEEAPLDCTEYLSESQGRPNSLCLALSAVPISRKISISLVNHAGNWSDREATGELLIPFTMLPSNCDLHVTEYVHFTGYYPDPKVFLARYYPDQEVLLARLEAATGCTATCLTRRLVPDKLPRLPELTKTTKDDIVSTERGDSVRQLPRYCTA